MNLVGYDDMLDADLKVLVKIAGGTSPQFDRHAFLRKVLSISQGDWDSKTALTIDALNYKHGKMSIFAAQIITRNYD